MHHNVQFYSLSEKSSVDIFALGLNLIGIVVYMADAVTNVLAYGYLDVIALLIGFSSWFWRSRLN